MHSSYLKIEAPINARIRVWNLMTAARFQLKRRREIEFVLASFASNKREHVRPKTKMFKFQVISDSVLKSECDDKLKS